MYNYCILQNNYKANYLPSSVKLVRFNQLMVMSYILVLIISIVVSVYYALVNMIVFNVIHSAATTVTKWWCVLGRVHSLLSGNYSPEEKSIMTNNIVPRTNIVITVHNFQQPKKHKFYFYFIIDLGLPFLHLLKIESCIGSQWMNDHNHDDFPVDAAE